MKQKIIFVLCLLSGIMLINSGLNKFFNYIPVPEDLPENMVKVNEAFMTIGWLMPLVGFVEVIGGLLFVFPKTRALGAIVLFPVLIGILLTHIFNVPEGLAVALVFLAINLWVIYENRQKYLPMIR